MQTGIRGTRTARLLAAVTLVGAAGAAADAQPVPAADSETVAVLRARARTARRAAPVAAASAWDALVRSADSLLARRGDWPELRWLRGDAALSLAELRLAAAAADTSCAAAHQALTAAEQAQRGLPVTARVPVPALDSLVARLNVAAPRAAALMMRRYR